MSKSYALEALLNIDTVSTDQGTDLDRLYHALKAKQEQAPEEPEGEGVTEEAVEAEESDEGKKQTSPEEAGEVGESFAVEGLAEAGVFLNTVKDSIIYLAKSGFRVGKGVYRTIVKLLAVLIKSYKATQFYVSKKVETFKETDTSLKKRVATLVKVVEMIEESDEDLDVLYKDAKKLSQLTIGKTPLDSSLATTVKFSKSLIDGLNKGLTQELSQLRGLVLLVSRSPTGHKLPSEYTSTPLAINVLSQGVIEGHQPAVEGLMSYKSIVALCGSLRVLAYSFQPGSHSHASINQTGMYLIADEGMLGNSPTEVTYFDKAGLTEYTTIITSLVGQVTTLTATIEAIEKQLKSIDPQFKYMTGKMLSGWYKGTIEDSSISHIHWKLKYVTNMYIKTLIEMRHYLAVLANTAIDFASDNAKAIS